MINLLDNLVAVNTLDRMSNCHRVLICMGQPSPSLSNVIDTCVHSLTQVFFRPMSCCMEVVYKRLSWVFVM